MGRPTIQTVVVPLEDSPDLTDVVRQAAAFAAVFGARLALVKTAGQLPPGVVDRLLEGGQSIITAAEGELIPEREAIVRVAITGLTEAAEANGSETTGSETSS